MNKHVKYEKEGWLSWFHSKRSIASNLSPHSQPDPQCKKPTTLDLAAITMIALGWFVTYKRAVSARWSLRQEV
eukprot:4708099-Amphidinium_carterae.1